MDDFQANVEAILGSRRIKNKLVILCEGDRLPVDKHRAVPSVQMYRRLERMPDANFYKACVPRDWHDWGLPQFFNCGGRPDVIYTFEALLERHLKDPESSYLSPEKLYALVDLDLQPERMPEDALCKTLEEAHAAQYADGLLAPALDPQHRIWATALIHKEAFFVLPSAEAMLYHGVPPFLNDARLDLRALHVLAARRLETDGDIALHFPTAVGRLARFTAGSKLDHSCATQIGESWIAEASAAHDASYESMVRSLLSIAKIKPLWTKVVPDPAGKFELPAETYREQLALNVARGIAEQSPEEHPLSGFFAWLKPRR